VSLGNEAVGGLGGVGSNDDAGGAGQGSGSRTKLDVRLMRIAADALGLIRCDEAANGPNDARSRYCSTSDLTPPA